MVGGQGTDPAGTAWVIGSRGLLGRAVTKHLRSQGRHVEPIRVPWNTPDADQVLRSVAASLPRHGADVYWCAGAGVINSASGVLERELVAFQAFLDGWPSDTTHSALFVASSAGGVYGMAGAPPFTEDTEPAPVTAYGEARLAAEKATREFSERTGVAVLIGRISNLYGPGQDLAKPQGLISVMCRAYVTRRPMNIYVSGDTLRDYLYVDDAAAMITTAVSAVQDRGGFHLKILASEQPASINAVVGHLAKVSRRRPPVVFAASPLARGQVRDLRFRSTAWPPTRHLARTPLPTGISETLDSIATQWRGPSSHP